jgi:hypothetical protein
MAVAASRASMTGQGGLSARRTPLRDGFVDQEDAAVKAGPQVDSGSGGP